MSALVVADGGYRSAKSGAAALKYDQGAYLLLRELGAYPRANAQLQSCAALLSNHSHSALYEIANEDHAALPLLLPLSEYRLLLVRILERLDAHHRASMCSSYPRLRL